jgi:hypothetical protein
MAVHLAVTYRNDVTRWFPVPPDEGWHIDKTDRKIVVGRGVPRTEIPLDNVFYYEIQPREETERDLRAV